MPNVKIYLDDTIADRAAKSLQAELIPIREMLCAELGVEAAACQLAVVTVHGLADQPQVNVELAYLAKPERTRARMEEVCIRLQAMVSQAIGTHSAVRADQLDPAVYVALK